MLLLSSCARPGVVTYSLKYTVGEYLGKFFLNNFFFTSTQYGKSKKKKFERVSLSFKNLSKSPIFSVRSCERGFSGPKTAVKFLES